MAPPSSRNPPWRDFEYYPQRLPDHSPNGEDAEQYEKRLNDDSPRLFSKPDQLSVDIQEFFKDRLWSEVDKPMVVESREKFEECLTKGFQQGQHTLCYTLKPLNVKVWSWSTLYIPLDLARKLLQTHQVMPVFLDFLRTFGSRARSSDLGFGGGRYKLQFARPSANEKSPRVRYYEIVYNLNYAFRNDRRKRDSSLDPFSWSMRKMAIYHKSMYEDNPNIWILLTPPENLQKRLPECFHANTLDLCDSERLEPLETHLVYFSTASENWREYINTLEAFFQNKATSARNYIVQKQSPNSSATSDPRESLEVGFNDVQLFQKFQDLVQSLQCLLENNKDALCLLRDLNRDLRTFNNDPGEKISWYTIDNTLRAHEADIVRHTRNTGNLLLQIKGHVKLLYHILDFENSTLITSHGELRTEFDKASRRDTQAMTDLNKEMHEMSTQMLKMSERTVRDAVSMKVITFVALLYLPATFVATFLNSGITQFSDSLKSSIDFSKMRFSKEAFLMFIFLTIPLLLVTLGGWYIWDKRAARTIKKDIT